MPAEPLPKVPEGPTVPTNPAGPVAKSPAPAVARDGESERRPTGGRRSNDDLLEENRQLAARLTQLTTAALPFAAVPDDPAKGPDEVLYILSRGGKEAKISPGQIRLLRSALSLI